MSVLKKKSVVMLPTNEKATEELLTLCATNPRNNQLMRTLSTFNGKVQEYIDNKQLIPQHLYFISDEQTKEGDWCIDLDTYKLFQLGKWETNRALKIIATTDSSLKISKSTVGYTETRSRTFYSEESLPQPSQSFIEKYIDKYNKGEQITEVMVEYEWNKYPDIHGVEYDLKINTKDNTITIKPVKDSWNREEVISIVQTYREFAWKHGVSLQDSDKWIKENLF